MASVVEDSTVLWTTNSRPHGSMALIASGATYPYLFPNSAQFGLKAILRISFAHPATRILHHPLSVPSNEHNMDRIIDVMLWRLRYNFHRTSGSANRQNSRHRTIVYQNDRSQPLLRQFSHAPPVGLQAPPASDVGLLYPISWGPRGVTSYRNSSSICDDGRRVILRSRCALDHLANEHTTKVCRS